MIGDASLYPQKLKRQREIEALLENNLEEWTKLNEQMERIEAAYE